MLLKWKRTGNNKFELIDTDKRTEKSVKQRGITRFNVAQIKKACRVKIYDINISNFDSFFTSVFSVFSTPRNSYYPHNYTNIVHTSSSIEIWRILRRKGQKETRIEKKVGDNKKMRSPFRIIGRGEKALLLLTSFSEN